MQTWSIPNQKKLLNYKQMANNTNTNEQAWQLLVLLLKKIAAQKGITQEQIAKRTGYYESNVNRVFALKYKPRLDVFLNLANAIGVNFFFEDRDNTDIDYNRLM